MPVSVPAAPVRKIQAGDLTTDLDLTPQELVALLDLAGKTIAAYSSNL
jgi:hypothetical protein